MSAAVITGLSYLATPYSTVEDGHDTAFARSARIAGLLARTGIKLFCPVVHGHPMIFYAKAGALDGAFWSAFNAPFLRMCDCLIVAHLPGWEESKGIAEEVAFFEYAKRPIWDCDPQSLVLKRRAAPGPQQELVDQLVERSRHG